MDQKQRLKRNFLRALVEIGFILFLFYANLLMGEYVRSANPNKSFLFGLQDVVTYKNFGIGIFCAVVGYVVFEQLRKLP
jgi:hypothetical protein